MVIKSRILTSAVRVWSVAHTQVEIQSTAQLNNLLESIRGLPEVYNVYRVQPRGKNSADLTAR